jgi:hypothetical protein
MSDFSSANVALVAYAAVAADGTLLQNSGFVSCTKYLTGTYELVLEASLVQEPNRDLLMVTPNGGGAPVMTLAYHSIPQKIVVSLKDETNFRDQGFALMVWRSVIPLP